MTEQSLGYQKKSLSYYANRILEYKNLKILTELECSEIDKFDDAVLIIDDLLDGSLTRNGEPCFYLKYGKEKARETSLKLHEESIFALQVIAKTYGLNDDEIKACVNILNKLKEKIYEGESIDKELQQTEIVDSSLIEKYDRMIKLFTGGHVKAGVEIGFALSQDTSDEKKRILEIAEHKGIIRQIEDDLNDYEENHHEPLGDIKNHKKRLPELLFLLNSSKSEQVELEKELNKDILDAQKIKRIVFNERVEDLIQEKINFHKYKIDTLKDRSISTPQF